MLFICGRRHIRAVGCMLEIEGWTAGGTLEDEEEEEEEEEGGGGGG